MGLMDKIGDMADKVKDEVAEKLHRDDTPNADGGGQDAMDTAKEYAVEAKDKAEELAASAKEHAGEAVDKLKGLIKRP